MCIFVILGRSYINKLKQAKEVSAFKEVNFSQAKRAFTIVVNG
jgi:hypothetical protein